VTKPRSSSQLSVVYNVDSVDDDVTLRQTGDWPRTKSTRSTVPGCVTAARATGVEVVSHEPACDVTGYAVH